MDWGAITGKHPFFLAAMYVARGFAPSCAGGCLPSLQIWQVTKAHPHTHIARDYEQNLSWQHHLILPKARLPEMGYGNGQGLAEPVQPCPSCLFSALRYPFKKPLPEGVILKTIAANSFSVLE
jgi:hypothetical protein